MDWSDVMFLTKWHSANVIMEEGKCGNASCEALLDLWEYGFTVGDSGMGVYRRESRVSQSIQNKDV